jgi:hypothetical protein
MQYMQGHAAKTIIQVMACLGPYPQVMALPFLITFCYAEIPAFDGVTPIGFAVLY